MAFSDLNDNSSKSGKTDQNERNVTQVMSAFKRLRVNDNNECEVNANCNRNRSQSETKQLSKTVTDVQSDVLSECQSHTTHNSNAHTNLGHRRRTQHTNLNRDKLLKWKRNHSVVNQQSFDFGAQLKYAIQDFSELNPVLFKQNQTIAINSKTGVKPFNSYRLEKSDSSLSATTTATTTTSTTNCTNKLNIIEDKTCSQQALRDTHSDISGDVTDASVDELAAYFSDNLYLPRKMSFMAEMMYT